MKFSTTIKDIANDITGADESFIVDVSNPVCPHCGAKLTLHDDTVDSETDDLCTVVTKEVTNESMNESFNKYYNIMNLIHERLNQYIEEVLCSAPRVDEFGNEYKLDKYDLLYNDEVSKPILERFCVDVHTYILDTFGIDVNNKELLLTIKNELKNKLN